MMTCDVELVIIRHGQTPGNAQHRYVGALDQPLSEQGRAEARDMAPRLHAVLGDVKRAYVSTLVRTHETAELLFPEAEQVVVDGIQEMDFGDFSGRTADEMADDDAYRAWVEGNCEGSCPNGESRDSFTQRVCSSPEQLLRAAAERAEWRVVLVAHGGTMMASLSRFSDDERSYYEWNPGNCRGYRIDVDLSSAPMSFTRIRPIV